MNAPYVGIVRGKKQELEPDERSGCASAMIESCIVVRAYLYLSCSDRRSPSCSSMYPMSTEVTETCYHTELTGWMDDVAQISEKSLHKSVNDQLL